MKDNLTKSLVATLIAMGISFGGNYLIISLFLNEFDLTKWEEQFKGIWSINGMWMTIVLLLFILVIDSLKTTNKK